MVAEAIPALARRVAPALLPVVFFLAPAQSADNPALLHQMTLDEKLSLVHGARDPRQLGQAGYWPGLARLGIPPLRLADGPAGVYVNRDATAMPAPVALSATFNPEAARLYGVVMGREAKAVEQDILLAPHINIVRDPLFRRNHTTLSEDPLLTARLAAAEVIGIQSQGVMAQVKHLAGYNGSADVRIDERTLHEIYLPAFEAAIQAGAASVMCAYSRINGGWSCENADLQNAILRGQWGFQGFVTSDWGAVHSPQAITKGLDLEMPGREIANRNSGPYFTAPLKTAVENGEIPIAAIDQAVTRILSQMDRFHLLDRQPPARPRIDIEADARVVRQIAGQGAVLLTNVDDALPLSAADLASLALIGPTAGQLAAGFMGERAYGFESRLVSPLAALHKLTPRANIVYAVGDDLSGVPIPGSTDFKGSAALPPGKEYSWTGTLPIPAEGDYTFMVQPALGEGSQGSGVIAIDGRPVVRSGGFAFAMGVAPRKWSSLLPTTDGHDNSRAIVRLTAGEHRVEITGSSTGEKPLAIRFAWMTPELRQVNIAAAVAAAGRVRTPVVFAWNGAGTTLTLPDDQDDLIRQVAAANSRTIVVLNTGGPVAMPWKDSVRAILEMWYPGQEGGWATADLLLGRVNPSGKLPVTFPMGLEDTPMRAPGHPERLATPVADYSEGLAVGYRWYDQQGIKPLFPFGHGLSYTRFACPAMSVTRTRGGADVAFTLRNTGSRQGAEVAQVYVIRTEPPKSLAGFERIELNPGQSRRVVIHLDARALSYWSVEKHAWVRSTDIPVCVDLRAAQVSYDEPLHPICSP